MQRQPIRLSCHKCRSGTMKSFTPRRMPGELEKIQKQQAKETLDLTARQAGEMVDLINDIFMGIDTDELNLGEQILTDDEKQALLEKLTEVQLKASEIKLSTTSAGKPDTSPNTDVDILGMSSSQWEDFFQHLEDGKLGIEDLQNAVTVLSSAWSAYRQLRSAQEKKELKEYEKIRKRKKLLWTGNLNPDKSPRNNIMRELPNWMQISMQNRKN